MSSPCVYLLANDRVRDQAVAWLRALRRHEPRLDVVLIPFDERFERLMDDLRRVEASAGRIQVYPALELLDWAERLVQQHLPQIQHPARLRCLAAWLGPSERFLYSDADLLLLQDVRWLLDPLEEHDFVVSDYQHKTGLTNVFRESMKSSGLLAPGRPEDVFNGGLWASTQGLFSEDDLEEGIRAAGRAAQHLDLAGGLSAQPVLNFLVLRRTVPHNLTRADSNEPGSWAGSPHFRRSGETLYDGDRPLRYLHWAGQPIGEGGPYWDVWSRFAGSTEP